MIRVLGVALALSTAVAAAQVRSIPAEAKRGEIRHLQEMDVAIDGKPMRLAAGAQIRDESNRVLLPTALPAGARVKYTLDQAGYVFRVWILSAQEAAQPDPRK
jgi:hypothetical protein